MLVRIDLSEIICPVGVFLEKDEHLIS